MKIAVIGNAAGGKTWLSRRLAARYRIPLFHVDSIQFDGELRMRPHRESAETLRAIAADRPDWIIDGYGPLDTVLERLALADRIVFIDLPLARHLGWLLKRQLTSLWRRRAELPPGRASEVRWAHTRKVIQYMLSQHRQMRPEMIRILAREKLASKVHTIRTVAELRRYDAEG
jgi:adenylate kinase family enzyme